MIKTNTYFIRRSDSKGWKGKVVDVTWIRPEGRFWALVELYSWDDGSVVCERVMNEDDIRECGLYFSRKAFDRAVTDVKKPRRMS